MKVVAPSLSSQKPKEVDAMILHEHTPCKHKSRLIAFLHLLISPRKVFIYYTDGADICGVCGTHITVPCFYYSPIANVLYVLFGIFLMFVASRLLPQLTLLGVLVGTLLIHHIYSAAVFAFAPWDAYDPEIRGSESCTKEAKRDQLKKGIALGLGIAIFRILVI